jgi:microcompartment protein CcmL/EutN
VKKYPAIAVVEFSSIADGIYTTDAILKKAAIAMIKGGTISHGRYLTIFGGTTGSVSESLTEALTIARG